MNKAKQLIEKRASIQKQIDDLMASVENRSMTEEEASRFDELEKQFNEADRELGVMKRAEEISRKQLSEAFREEARDGKDDKESEFRAAFYKTLRGDALTPEERNLLAERRAALDGVNGAILVPSTLAGYVEVAMKSYGGMMEASNVLYTASGGSLTFPTINGTDGRARIVAEYGQSSKGKVNFGSMKLGAHTYRTDIIPISYELLQDSAFNVESLIGDVLADQFGRGLNEDFTVGDGNDKPTGVLSEATVGVNAAESAVTYDNLVDLKFSVDARYRRGARWMFNSNTHAYLMKLVDKNGRPILIESVRDEEPDRLLGVPITINEDMPNIGAGNASVLFGDFSKYKARIVKGFSIVRLQETLAEYLSIGIMGYARADGRLLDAGTHPIKKLLHAGMAEEGA